MQLDVDASAAVVTTTREPVTHRPPPQVPSKHRGRKRGAAAAVVDFVACARDVAPSLPRRSGQLEALGLPFADYSVLVWEEGSSDRTRALLRAWAARNPHVRLLLSRWRWLGGKVLYNRVTRIGHCRNLLLAETLRHTRRVPPRQQHGFMVVVDLDCQPLLTPAAFTHSVGRLTATRMWDVLAANTRPAYVNPEGVIPPSLLARSRLRRQHSARVCGPRGIHAPQPVVGAPPPAQTPTRKPVCSSPSWARLLPKLDTFLSFLSSTPS